MPPTSMFPGALDRRGLTLLEIATVLAIIGILAAIGGPMLTSTLPEWRTRRAAKELSALVGQARARAIAEQVEYPIVFEAGDADLSDDVNAGRYVVARGDASDASTSWDILPVERDGGSGDAQMGEGTVDIGLGGEDVLRDVSIQEASLPDSRTLSFSPRGWLSNDAGDFDADGYINITFTNTRALRVDGVEKSCTVRVSRGGMTRTESTQSSPVVDGPAGTDRASTVSANSGSGFHPGGVTSSSSGGSSSSSSGASSSGASSGSTSSSSGSSSSGSASSSSSSGASSSSSSGASSSGASSSSSSGGRPPR